MADWNEHGYQRRIIGYHGYRLDGLSDLLPQCKDVTVLDIGCNRGMASYDLALCGAAVVHGCDNYERGMLAANEVFADIRSVKARFEVVDLTKGAAAIEGAFGSDFLASYDFVMMLAVYHKLRRVMQIEALLDLVEFLARHCGRYFIWRGSRQEMDEFEGRLKLVGFRLVHYSELAEIVLPGDKEPTPQPAAIWRRVVQSV